MLKPLYPEEARKVRTLLSQCRYQEEALEELTGFINPPKLPGPSEPSAKSPFSQTSALTGLVQCFFLGHPIDAAVAGDSWPAWFLDLCLDCGLLEPEKGHLRPRALLVPCVGFLVASDLHDGSQDRVLPVNPPARHLLNFSIRCPVDSALDLCSGNALHAIVAAQFSGHVTTSDVNSRAGEFARFNAALNDVIDLECLTGNGFETVEGRTYDLILCNPPFVISPDTELIYQNTEQELDHFCRQLTWEAPEHLNEGGFFQMICEWVELEGEPWQDRIANWVKGSGCDTWVIHANRELPESYTHRHTREDRKSTERWTAFFRKHGVNSVHGGLLTMRRRSDGKAWLRIDPLEKAVSAPVGEALLQGFASQDVLEKDDDHLRTVRPRISTAVQLEEKSHWDGHGWQPGQTIIRLMEGLPGSAGMDATTLDFLRHSDGEQTVAELIAGFAERHHLEVEQVQEKGLNLVRQLIYGGFLLP